ncbi:MAG: nickel insertion protein [Solidesulfovibrio sp. DCME]|uniref:nickel insertion protein n=1 Tax=Solidesulfovibrio sp. DCME TaxID=3447380 RepID=UPI003D13E5D0
MCDACDAEYQYKDKVNGCNNASQPNRYAAHIASDNQFENFTDKAVEYEKYINGVLVIRPCSGLSGDMFVSGLATLLGCSSEILEDLAKVIKLPELEGSLLLTRKSIQGIGGWCLSLSLPHMHSHNKLKDIIEIINKSNMTDNAKQLAIKAFAIIAEAEGKVHGVAADQITFHEVGALDSILDICLACILYDKIKPARFVCGPLPVCDGTVVCCHGVLSTPVPAVLEMLGNMPVVGVPTCGETITPTAVALLKAFDAQFGAWPGMIVQRAALVYGTNVLPNIPNGVIFSYGVLN